jgi:hypothetical protein
MERIKTLATDIEDGMEIIDEDEAADDIRKLLAAYEAVKAFAEHLDSKPGEMDVTADDHSEWRRVRNELGLGVRIAVAALEAE